jgi:hypothetical protein
MKVACYTCADVFYLNIVNDNGMDEGCCLSGNLEERCLMYEVRYVSDQYLKNLEVTTQLARRATEGSTSGTLS